MEEDENSLQELLLTKASPGALLQCIPGLDSLLRLNEEQKTGIKIIKDPSLLRMQVLKDNG